MPVTVGGRSLGPPPDVLLSAFADTFVEAREVGVELRRLNRKAHKQNVWLWANEGHPLWGERTTFAILTTKKFEYWLETLHKLARRADDLVKQMDGPTRQQALTDVHAWAELGGAAIYGHAWGFAPVPVDEIPDYLKAAS